MKLGATITSERGKPATKTANSQLECTINIENKDIGRVVAQYEEPNGTTIYYYPIGSGGRILLHKTNGNLKHGTCDSM